jgi:hypothetical protein
LIVTENGAATKLCPFIREPEIKADDAGSMIVVYRPIHCRGPKCMAWRWVDEFPAYQPAGDRRGSCGMAILLGVAT